MNRIIVIPVILMTLCAVHSSAIAQVADPPGILWQKSYFPASSNDGFPNASAASGIIATSDGGFVVAGYCSYDNINPENHGGTSDPWIFKVNATGTIVWQTVLLGSGWDVSYSVTQTSDGGFAAVGFAYSHDSNFSMNHAQEDDGWVAKLDSNGTVQWVRCLGSIIGGSISAIIQTSDGGLAMAGGEDGNLAGNHGITDVWVIKLKPTGDLAGQNCFGGDSEDMATSIIQTYDGGFAVGGWTQSSNGDVVGSHGSEDAWIVKLNASGMLEWQKCLGGSSDDACQSIIQSADSGLVMTGYTASKDGDVQGNHGGEDLWVVKLDRSGELQWQKCCGSGATERGWSIIQSSDGDFVVAGECWANGEDVSGNHGNADGWIVKLSPSGDLVWQRCIGGSDFDRAYSIIQTSDGSFAIAAYSSSTDGDATGNAAYGAWLVRLGASSGVSFQECSQSPAFTISPDPASNTISVNYSLSFPTEVSLALYSITGKRVYQTIAHEAEGMHLADIDLTKFPAGTYCARMVAGTLTSSKLVQIIR